MNYRAKIKHLLIGKTFSFHFYNFYPCKYEFWSFQSGDISSRVLIGCDVV